MSADISNKLTSARDTTNPVTTTVASTRAISGTSLSCVSLDGWPTDTAVHFITYKKTTAGLIDKTTQCDWKGVVSGTTIGTLTLKNGTDGGNAVGDFVQMAPTAAWEQDYADALTTSLNQDGTLKTGAVDVSAVLADGVVSNAKLSTDISPAKFANPYKFSVYLNASQTLTSGTFTRIAFDTREYDTSSNVDISSTKGQFTAPVAGYYQFSFSVGWNTTASLSRVIGSIYKNGSEFKRCSDVFVSSGAAGSINGTTEMSLAANDTVSVFVDGIGAAAVLNTGAAVCWFQGELKSAS